MKLFISLTAAALLMFTSCGEKEQSGEEPETEGTDSVAVENYEGSFYFVGQAEYTPGLYKYDFETGESEKVWSKNREYTLDLSFNDTYTSGFFATARRYGKKGVFPYVTDVRLYHLEPDSGIITQVKEKSSGLQMFSYWPSDSVFSFYLNAIDLTISSYIIQHVYSFTDEGKMVDKQKFTYDITQEGYPSFPVDSLSLSSGDGKYAIVIEKGDTAKYYLKFYKDSSKNLITSSAKQLKDVHWYRDTLLIFSLIDISPSNNTLYEKDPKTAELYVYSAKRKKLINMWRGGGLMNYRVLGNYLIFDREFYKESVINIFDLNTGSITDKIEVKGGSGLKKIPRVPDYDA